MITVKELIEQLQKCDPDRVVICAKDPEGNGYSPYADMASENCTYQADTTWSGEIGLEHLTDEFRSAGYSDEDVIEDGVRCVVLWPVN